MSPGGHPRVDAIASEARGAIEAAASSADLEALRVRFLGRQGELTQLLRSLGTLPAEERPVVGAAANEAKRALETLLESRLAETAEKERRRQREQSRLDLTLPGRRPPLRGAALRRQPARAGARADAHCGRARGRVAGGRGATSRAPTPPDSSLTRWPISS